MKFEKLNLSSVLWGKLNLNRKRQVFLLILLMLLSSISEVITLGAIFPFLAVLNSPETVFNSPYAQYFIHFLKIESADQVVLPIALVFALSAFVSGLIRIFLLYFLTKVSFSIGVDISEEIYRRVLHQPYLIHTTRNSSELINGIVNKTHMVVNGVILPLLTIVSSIVLLIGIVLTLLAVDASITLVILFGFGFVYMCILLFTKDKIKNNSKVIALESTKAVKLLQEGLGGIRDVIINSSQEYYYALYKKSDLMFRTAQGSNVFLSGAPRYAIESFGIVLIAFFAYMASRSEGGMVEFIPILGVFALGFQRLLPVLQQLYASISNIKGSRSVLFDIVALLECDTRYNKTGKSIAFDKHITLNNVRFKYNNESHWIFQGVNIKINKGDFIGVVGPTGGGKSTMIDIITGLLEPTSGVFKIDGIVIDSSNQEEWQKHISHVPQNIFLSDSTIEQNIAFGISKDDIDFKKVKYAAKLAQISDYINLLPEKYNTIVGENGVRLSGGQRQRIGIARALYRNSDVIILDEATSALDVETEALIMKSIENIRNKFTVIMITHRLSTLANCKKVITVNKGVSCEKREDRK
jgi:ATP-binding cassette, subfamily B, bacterial PglK